MIRWLACAAWVAGRLYVSHAFVVGSLVASTRSIGLYQLSRQD